MRLLSSIVSFSQSLIAKAAAKALPRLLSNHWLDCLYTDLECRVHHIIDLDHFGPVWTAQVLKRYDDFLGSAQFRLDGLLWRLSKTEYDWYGVVRYHITSPEGYTRTFWSEESRTSDELKQLRYFSTFMEDVNPGSADDMGLYTHKDILELKEAFAAARKYVTSDSWSEPYWAEQLPARLELALHLTEPKPATEPQCIDKQPCPNCGIFHGPPSLCTLLDNNNSIWISRAPEGFRHPPIENDTF